MKRQLEKLNKNDLRRIERWFNLKNTDKLENCPFSGLRRLPKNNPCYRCKAIFPGLKPYELKYFFGYYCPCTSYSLSYVKRVVRQVLDRKKTINKNRKRQRKNIG